MSTTSNWLLFSLLCKTDKSTYGWMEREIGQIKYITIYMPRIFGLCYGSDKRVWVWEKSACKHANSTKPIHPSPQTGDWFIKGINYHVNFTLHSTTTALTVSNDSFEVLTVLFEEQCAAIHAITLTGMLLFVLIYCMARCCLWWYYTVWHTAVCVDILYGTLPFEQVVPCCHGTTNNQWNTT